MKYYSAKTVTQLLGVTAQTLRNWDNLRKFRMLLQDRIKRYQTSVVIADKYYASTKKCMRCGKIKEMKINDRIYNCDYCGLIIDRDYNSAINLANYI